ncbi:MAG: hypothetical protein NTZ83_06070 [Candidatus Pacearchaeota archaeon]|nr:hypothetical protein [Candidatus Pacearchaeota archaeon]
MKKRYIQLLGLGYFILGIFLSMNAEAGITGAVIGSSAVSSAISLILGLVFVIVGMGVLAGGKLEERVKDYPNLKEKYTGFKYETFKRDNLDKQAKFLSDMVEGITSKQAKDILELTYEQGLDLVIGGSSFKNNRLGGDLDLGFKISQKNIYNANKEDLKDTIRVIKNKINKKVFGREYRKVHSGEGNIFKESWIYDGSNPENIPKIGDVREFFQRYGIRKDINPDKKDKPFGPSGYAHFKKEGEIIYATPIYKKGVVGINKNW